MQRQMGREDEGERDVSKTKVKERFAKAPNSRTEQGHSEAEQWPPGASVTRSVHVRCREQRKGRASNGAVQCPPLLRPARAWAVALHGPCRGGCLHRGTRA